ncbi:MAG: metallophosphoesterase [Gammaproteobacteria bacterium]
MSSRACWTLVRAGSIIVLLLVFGVGHVVAAPALQDGPYVAQSADGAWVARWVSAERGADSAEVREQKVRIGDEVSVAAVGSLPSFKVRLRKTPGIAPNDVKLPSTTPLFVMADTHGEFEIAVELLRNQHVIDSALRWQFGRGRLAVLGDVFDRGPNQTEIFWLLYKLEAEAARAGGGVHLMLGNHETMALGGDDRYLNPKYQQVKGALHAPNYAALWSETTLLGQWLRTKATVTRIGDYLCLHGGLSRELVDRKLTLEQINAEVRASLGKLHADSFVMSNAGPQWYRGYFAEAARAGGFKVATSEDIDAILAFYGARAIFVGHTIVPTVESLYGGRVIAVQVYPHRDEPGGRKAMEGLLVKDGKFFRARIDGGVEPLG